jgi:hypothetical protein
VTPSFAPNVIALTVLLAALWPADAAPLNTAGARVEQVILDIVSFTRWPKPMPLLSLCAVGTSAYASQFLDATINSDGITVHTKQMSLEDAEIGAQCDIVYEGALTAHEREKLVYSLAGHPVLTVGESEAGCMHTTMFCLELSGLPMSATQAGDRRIPFSSNLDAIARSGVRLNPRVLLLGRSVPATP